MKLLTDPRYKQQRIMAAGAVVLFIMNLFAIWTPHSNNSVHIPVEQPKQTKVKTAKVVVDDNRFLLIKEWGVKIPVSGELKSLTYKVVGNEVRFTRPDLEAFGCKASSIGLPIGLVRSNTKQVSEVATHTATETSFRRIGTQWYSLAGAQAMCFEQPPTELPGRIASSYEAASTALEPALRQIQAI
jgi:hypothetical protein